MVTNKDKKLNTEFKKLSERASAMSLNTKKTLRQNIVLKKGQVCDLRITALSNFNGPNKIGIDEYSFNYPILVPQTVVGEKIKAKIIKVVSSLNKKTQYVIAQKISTNSLTESTNTSNIDGGVLTTKAPALGSLASKDLTLGSILTVNIDKINSKGAGVVKMSNNFYIIIPKIKDQGIEEKKQKVQILVTKVKQKYAFAQIQTNSLNNKEVSKGQQPLLTNSNFTQPLNKFKNEIAKGSKMTLQLPQKKKHFANFFILKLTKLAIQNSPSQTNSKKILFIKKGLNAKPGDFVRIQITSIIPHKNLVLITAKIVQVNPLSKSKKTQLIENDIRQMIKSGLHFGDKALKCNAQMKKYIWLKKTRNQNKLSKFNFIWPNRVENSTLQVKDGLLGSKASTLGLNSSFNGTSGTNSSTFGTNSSLVGSLDTTTFFSKKKKSNLSKNNNILNILKTRRCLYKVLNSVGKYAIKGTTFLFIGTKKPAAALVSKASLLTKNSFFVNTKWLGGMLTNWKTILKSISKIRPILKEKQKIIKEILQKRQSIKTRLIQKALLLRNKSKLILKKGRSLITLLKSNLKEKNRTIYKKLTFKLAQTQYTLRNKNRTLIEKRQLLLEKRKKFMLQSLNLKEKAFILLNSYKNVFNELTVTKQKLRQLQFLLVLTNLINNNANVLPNKQIYTVFSNINGLKASQSLYGNDKAPSSFVLPKDILNLITQFAKSFNTSIDKKAQAKETTSNKILLINKVLSKLTQFISNVKPAINTVLQQLIDKTKQLQTQAQNIKQAIKSIKDSLVKSLEMKKKIVNELKTIKNQFISERMFANVLKKKIKQLVSQKRFIQFLPKLRYLPISQAKITETIQILMKKIVDPKLKYPIDSIYNQVLNTKFKTNSKKVLFDRKKKWQRLEKYFGGIAKVLESTAKMSLNTGSSGARRNNQIVAILIGQQEEMNAVRECQKLGIKMIHVVDSNCNPGLADHFIPANDDSRSSIKYVLSKILTRIRMAQKLKIALKRFNINKKKKTFTNKKINNRNTMRPFKKFR